MKIETNTHNLLTREARTWETTILVRGGALRASSVLARRGSEVAVFDTGLPHHTASLVSALAAQGLEPDDVTLVFNTHSHVDHSHNNALFQRARIFGSRRDREWTRAMHEALARVERPTAEDVIAFYPEMASTAYEPKIVRKVLGIEKLLWDEKCWGHPSQFVWLEDDAPPSGICVIETPGHAPHHVSYVINTSSRPVLVTGDALLVRNEAHSALQLVPPYNLAAYQCSQAVINSFDGIIVPGHDEPFENGMINETMSDSPAI